MPLQRTRLFGGLAHVDQGKTTVTEHRLCASGRIHRMAEVHLGTATLDHLPAVIHRPPGHVDTS